MKPTTKNLRGVYTVVYRFPSPCGDLVMKQDLKKEFLPDDWLKVSIPLRGIGDETAWLKSLKKAQQERFPSPCGELVMKRDYVTCSLMRLIETVSVPLRGIGDETQPCRT